MGYLEPGGIGRVISGLQLKLAAGHQSHVATAHHPGTGIAPNVAERIQLLQIDIVHSRLLPQLSRCGLLRRFIRPDEAARERPMAQIRVRTPPDQQNPQLLVRKLAVTVRLVIRNSEDHHVRRYRGPFVILNPVPLHKLAFRQTVAIQPIHQLHLPLPVLN
ncbi:hypothetical protein D3C71_1214520 [compost metagenome]